MDGLFHGKPYEQMDDLGGFSIIFGNTHMKQTKNGWVKTNRDVSLWTVFCFNWTWGMCMYVFFCFSSTQKVWNRLKWERLTVEILWNSRLKLNKDWDIWSQHSCHVTLAIFLPHPPLTPSIPRRPRCPWSAFIRKDGDHALLSEAIQLRFFRWELI